MASTQNLRRRIVMKKMLKLSLPLLLILGGFTLPVEADDTLAKFKGGIGVIPVSSGVGEGATAETVNRNIVRGVQPAGQPWVIRNLKANVKTDGKIKVRGEGLLLGGGNNVGRTAGLSVFATLICVDGAGFTEHSSEAAGVPLDSNGNFRIDDELTPAPTSCDSPVLLIRNTATNKAWFAAGIPKSNE